MFYRCKEKKLRIKQHIKIKKNIGHCGCTSAIGAYFVHAADNPSNIITTGKVNLITGGKKIFFVSSGNENLKNISINLHCSQSP